MARGANRRLIQAAAVVGVEAMKECGYTDEQCNERSRKARWLNLQQYLPKGYHGLRWTADQVQLLGTLPDDVVATQIGRSVEAVRVMRSRQGPTARAWIPAASRSSSSANPSA